MSHQSDCSFYNYFDVCLQFPNTLNNYTFKNKFANSIEIRVFSYKTLRCRRDVNMIFKCLLNKLKILIITVKIRRKIVAIRIHSYYLCRNIPVSCNIRYNFIT